MKKQITIGIFSLMLASLLSACSFTGTMAPSTALAPTDEVMQDQKEDAMTAPDFELQDLAGNTVKLSDFSGEKVYIKYWASWCPICLGGLADINTLASEDIDFKILTIVSPGHKGEKNAKDFSTWFSGVENTENIIVLLDEDGTYTTAAGVRGYPTSEWIDGDGNILTIAPGHKDNDMIKTGFSDMTTVIE